MDSLGNYHNKEEAVQYLYAYLNHEYLQKQEEQEGVAMEGKDVFVLEQSQKLFNKDTMPLVVPKIPKQDNTYDCGVFVLKYAEKFLHLILEPEFIIDDAARDNSLENHITGDWFQKDDIEEKRIHLKKIIQQEQKLKGDKGEEEVDSDSSIYIKSGEKIIGGGAWGRWTSNPNPSMEINSVKSGEKIIQLVKFS
jgi:Ulp1 family protease